MAKRKIAMVAPVSSKQKIPPISDLADALEFYGIDRSYTVISHKGNIWKVHFEGDIEPKTIKFEDGQWVID